MKATEAKLLEFLKKSPQFVIPIYQRTYSWTERECRQLWDDILRIGRDEAVTAHFVGSIVYVEKGIYQVSSQSPLLVIDGQQRLTTVTLIIEALARSLGDSEPLDGFSAKKLRNYYLLNPLEDGERRYKLILAHTDKNSLKALLDCENRPKNYSIRIDENFQLFEKLIKHDKFEVSSLCRGLAKLIIVDIALNREQDNPQLIFESLNSTGRELSQADLIRNFILMGVEPELQTHIYERYWRPMEVDFGQEAYASHFDAFMRHYLTMKTGEIPNIRDVYESFKQYARSAKAGNVEELVSDIRTFASYFCRMTLESEIDNDLKAAFLDLRELKIDVAFPFLLELYKDYEDNTLQKFDFIHIIRLVESYVFRRAICSVPPNSLNKTFATFTKNIKRDAYMESIQAHFMTLPSYRRFPSDHEFIKELKNKDLYNFPRRNYWLRRLENNGRRELVYTDEYTIEHIMPQNENLSYDWQQALGEDWKRIHKTYLHTIGNLTLTKYNSEFGDRSFMQKRDMEGGFGQSPLGLNQGLGGLVNWNEEAILQRAERLASLAAYVWSAPKLEASVLSAYQPKVSISNYSIHDHPHLKVGLIRDLFDAFRSQTLALDPCVTEEFLKHYIAYKAETNFVDVVPQAKRLRLSLNVRFHEINDPRGLCKNVSGVGRWGNGDVEVGLTSADHLPYVMGLVRQSFDRQMLGKDT